MVKVKEAHPTRLRLLATAQQLIETLGPNGVTADRLLADSGVSRGSLYHHFRDLHDLLDHAHAERFASHVDASIALISGVLTGSENKEELLAGLRHVTQATQSERSLANRADRLWILAEAARSPTLRELLATEQQRLTDEIARLVEFAQARGWYRTDLDPYAMAVFIQAYTLGKAVDDITDRHMDAATWDELIMTIIVRAFLTDETSPT